MRLTCPYSSRKSACNDDHLASPAISTHFFDHHDDTQEGTGGATVVARLRALYFTFAVFAFLCDWLLRWLSCVAGKARFTGGKAREGIDRPCCEARRRAGVCVCVWPAVVMETCCVAGADTGVVVRRREPDPERWRRRTLASGSIFTASSGVVVVDDGGGGMAARPSIPWASPGPPSGERRARYAGERARAPSPSR